MYVGESPEGQVVAIKVLHARLSEEPQARERFLQEIAATRQVRQFCTARVPDADTSGDQPYVVSQYVEGISLSRLIATQGVRDPDALERPAVATVTALVTARSQARSPDMDLYPRPTACCVIVRCSSGDPEPGQSGDGMQQSRPPAILTRVSRTTMENPRPLRRSRSADRNGSDAPTGR